MKEIQMLAVTTLCLLFATFLPTVNGQESGATAKNPRASVPLEPVDTSKIGEMDLSQVAEQIKSLSSNALLLNKHVQALEEAFDGTPEFATKIALVKLKLLERLGAAIPITLNELEKFRIKGLIQQAQYQSEVGSMREQLAVAEREIGELSKKLREVNGELEGDDAVIMLLAKKIEALEELSGDYSMLEQAKTSLAKTLETVDQIEHRVESFTDLTREEVKRQAEAVRRSRLAKKSVVLNTEAERLLTAFQSLAPSVQTLDRRSPTLVVPEMVAASMPASPTSPVTQEMKAKMMAILRNASTSPSDTLSTNATVSRTAKKP